LIIRAREEAVVEVGTNVVAIMTETKIGMGNMIKEARTVIIIVREIKKLTLLRRKQKNKRRRKKRRTSNRPHRQCQSHLKSQ